MKDGARRYWRSLEQLAGDPRAREFVEREFPRGASELSPGLNRRTVLTLLGASLGLAGLTGCRRPEEAIVPFAEAPEEVIPGKPRYYATTMPCGLDAYGLVVESHEGRPTKIEGNPLHPSSLGGTSARIQAEILNLYDPDRSRRVLVAEPNGGTSQSAAGHGEPATEAAAGSRNESSWEAFAQAWRETEVEHLTDGGAGLAVISEPFSSPTLARLKRELLEQYPNAAWVAYAPLSDANVHAGVARAAGASLLPVCRFDRARVILALDSDFLLTESDSVRHARNFADGRRVDGGTAPMNRLYVVEGVHSLTGANADHRLALASSKIGAFVRGLARAIQARGGLAGAPDLPEGNPARVPRSLLDAIVQDLLAHAGECLIVAGRRQPPEVHSAVLALNSALGNVGRTVAYREPRDAELPADLSALAGLVRRMNAGEVTTLVVLGGNPVYDAPADLDLAGAMRRVARVIRLGSHDDETARLATWHIPRAHFLESWSDARCADGTLSVVQPLILPLLGGKSDIDLLGLLASGEDAPGYDRVRRTWRDILPSGRFERGWYEVLHDGLLRDSALPELAPAADAESLARIGDSTPEAGGLELVFVASPALHDGRHANNGWLQELPDPMTKLTWDNAATLSVGTAARLGLINEQMVRLRCGEREIELPVWILPGMADDTVAVALGYGRTAAGRVGSGVGFDAYALRVSDATGFRGGLTLQPGAGTHALAQTQDHWSMEHRPLYRQATLEHYREHPGFAGEVVELPVERSMWSEHGYARSPQWGMSIDLNACIGCNACVVACQSENNVPIVGREQVRKGREMHWLRIDRYFAGSQSDPQPETAFMPVPCMQCENAPCEQVCPVAATVHDGEGLNAMVYNRCIGTRYCSNNCPYKVRRFNFFNYTKDTPEIVRLAANPDVTVRSRGVMEKCTYCTQRIQAGKINAKLEGRDLRDGDVRTACQQACPTRAIRFGDILDGASDVARRKADPRNYTILEELYTKPRTSFLAKLRNPHPDLSREQG